MTDAIRRAVVAKKETREALEGADVGSDDRDGARRFGDGLGVGVGCVAN